MSTTMSKHAITRVRHEPRRRLLTVRHVERITPTMARVTLDGDLAGFVSASYDDHVKVFFPLPGDTEPTLPDPAPNGEANGAARSPGRDYTPRRFDTGRNELIIDFALHDAGPATDWATQAKPGQQLAVGGPRGSFVVPDDFDWYLFIGDETALPAIGRRLEELRAGTRAIVVAAVTGPGARHEKAHGLGLRGQRRSDSHTKRQHEEHQLPHRFASFVSSCLCGRAFVSSCLRGPTVVSSCLRGCVFVVTRSSVPRCPHPRPRDAP